MGGRRFFVTVLAGLLLALISLPANGALLTFGGAVDPVGGADPYPYADSIFWGYSDAEVLSAGINYDIKTFFVEFRKSGAPVTDLYFDYNDRKNPVGVENYPHIYANTSGQPIAVEFTSITFDSGTIEDEVTLNISLLGSGPSAQTIFSIDGTGGSRVSGTLDFTPIPIPGTLWLLGPGLIGLAGVRRRFRKSE